MALHFVAEDAVAATVGDLVEFGGAEAHHAAAVRRVRVGEAVTVGDGRGAWLEGECELVEQSRVRVRITACRQEPEASPRIVLAQALAKGDRDELAVQAATELGVDEIVPWQAARSVSRWTGEKTAKGRARWQTIVREAAKQAHRAWIPEVAEVSSTRELAARTATSRVMVLDPTGSVRLSSMEFDAAASEDVVLVVGPEGGIAPEELDAFERAGATVAALGATVLRTSTAGPAALALLCARLGRW
ncbi:16S rRNA (uracil(1498)-N(3))-methyltransferase [Microbacterium terrisoli]|uniref:16S rRNA (uracil(1498)-N(3))-methyltransferase n=1 Tax=Microbacterium terrisoli TaxID=3242192 RepID=UPI0028048D38|nr:16S rRNA (uracil(1498)-N(3))-methyltransferase [Microbacterium protaetiae]